MATSWRLAGKMFCIRVQILCSWKSSQTRIQYQPGHSLQNGRNASDAEQVETVNQALLGVKLNCFVTFFIF
jgi:hypothetical protein